MEPCLDQLKRSVYDLKILDTGLIQWLNKFFGLGHLGDFFKCRWQKLMECALFPFFPDREQSYIFLPFL